MIQCCTSYGRHAPVGGHVPVVCWNVVMLRCVRSRDISAMSFWRSNSGWGSRRLCELSTFHSVTIFQPISTPQDILKWSAQAQYNCNTSFLQLLQVACKFSTSCRKLVLQRCSAGVCTTCTSAIQLQYKKKFLYCSCIVVVLHLCGLLYAWQPTSCATLIFYNNEDCYYRTMVQKRMRK